MPSCSPLIFLFRPTASVCVCCVHQNIYAELWISTVVWITHTHMLVMIAFWCLWAAPLECDWHVEMPMCFRTVGAALVNVPYMCSSFVCIYVSLRVCVCVPWQLSRNNQSLQWIAALSRFWLKGDLLHINAAHRSINSTSDWGNTLSILTWLSFFIHPVMDYIFSKQAQLINDWLCVLIALTICTWSLRDQTTCAFFSVLNPVFRKIFKCNLIVENHTISNGNHSVISQC